MVVSICWNLEFDPCAGTSSEYARAVGLLEHDRDMVLQDMEMTRQLQLADIEEQHLLELDLLKEAMEVFFPISLLLSLFYCQTYISRSTRRLFGKSSRHDCRHMVICCERRKRPMPSAFATTSSEVLLNGTFFHITLPLHSLFAL